MSRALGTRCNRPRIRHEQDPEFSLYTREIAATASSETGRQLAPRYRNQQCWGSRRDGCLGLATAISSRA